MGFTSIKPLAAWKLDEIGPDSELRFDLVAALYNTPKSMVAATLVAVAVVWIAEAMTADASYHPLLLGFLVVGFLRVAANLAYLRKDHDRTDHDTTRLWELAALAGACSFATLVGLTGAYTVAGHAGSEAELLIGCCVIAYIAGISSRNASRPMITIGQISATCIPFVGALALAADPVHLALAAVIVALYASTIVMCRKVYDTIVARHRAQSKMERLALRDSLTNLLNRSAFFEVVEKALTRTNAAGCLGLIAIDLDRFKDVNDTLGHPSGDQVLRETAERLRSVVGPTDEIARIGGDEFLVLVRASDPTQVQRAARRIVDALQTPFRLEITAVSCGASLGYAIAPRDGSSLDELMRHADLALYAAKRQGGGTVEYRTELSLDYHEQMEILRDLQQALERGELELHYQPIVNPHDGRTVCCEALLRWRHPRRGLIPPSIFIPLAEATGLIVPFGAWVLRTACREATGWNSEINVAVNLSPIQFKNASALVETIMRALDESGLAAYRLELEVTENILIEDRVEALAIIRTLRRQQIGVSLDDFGTGFSSLGYLHEFPFSKLKLDRAFCRALAESQRSAAIVRGIVQITRDLRIELVAEGVETAAQLETLQGLGVNAIQGYLFSRPVTAPELQAVIARPIVPVLPSRKADARRRAANAPSAA